MTAEQQDAYRLEAWDRYAKSKATYFACRAQLRKWGRILTVLVGKLGDDPAKVIEQDYAFVPTAQTFAAGVKDMRNADKEFRSARQEAIRFGFHVDPDDLSD